LLHPAAATSGIVSSRVSAPLDHGYALEKPMLPTMSPRLLIAA
jgi:hypothetical protein